MNKPLPAADLSEAFAKPTRAAGIRLPARKAPQSPAESPQRPVSAVPDPSPASTASSPDIEPASESQAGPAATRRLRASSEQGRLVLWLPRSLHARMKAEQDATGTVYRDQILDALEATVDRLPELVAQASAPAAGHIKGRLFERAASTPTAEPARIAKVQLTVRGFLDSQLAVIDELAESTGAGSRSALVGAALDEVLR